MSRAERLAPYVRLIEQFLARASTAAAFSEDFFRAFQRDPGGWMDEPTYAALNGVATACECYSPDPPDDGLDLTAEQLRSETSKGLDELRRLGG